jgi:hypothetical protein
MTVDLAVSPGGRPADASPIGTAGGRKNWVDQTGGLPRYIRMIAHALIRKGMTPSHAIATAVNRVRKLAAGSTNPKVKAAAAAAVAEWEAKKAKAHLSLAYGDDPDAIVVDLAGLEDADAMLLLDLAPGNYRPPYDWKHGYIPITPAAALSKAKGNKKRASKLLRGGGRTPKVAGSRKPSPNRNPAEIRDTGSAERRSAERIRSKRVAKAQDDVNRGRGVPGELAAAKKTAHEPPARRNRNAEAHDFVKANKGKEYTLKTANGRWTPGAVNRDGQGEYVRFYSVDHKGITVDKFPDEASPVAAKKTAAPKLDKSPAAATLEAVKADRARMAAGAERRKAETPITPAVIADLNENLEPRRDRFDVRAWWPARQGRGTRIGDVQTGWSVRDT